MIILCRVKSFKSSTKVVKPDTKIAALNGIWPEAYVLNEKKKASFQPLMDNSAIYNAAIHAPWLKPRIISKGPDSCKKLFNTFRESSYPSGFSLALYLNPPSEVLLNHESCFEPKNITIYFTSIHELKTFVGTTIRN